MAKKPKLTKWFDGSVKPVRDGVYQRRHFVGKVYSLFSNGHWCLNQPTTLQASRAYYFSSRQDLPWRGLAEQPKEGV